VKVKKPDGLVSETLKGIPLPGGLGRNTPHYYGGRLAELQGQFTSGLEVRLKMRRTNSKREIAARKGMGRAQALPGNDVLTR
jgi:hypothetical protein